MEDATEQPISERVLAEDAKPAGNLVEHAKPAGNLVEDAGIHMSCTPAMPYSCSD